MEEAIIGGIVSGLVSGAVTGGAVSYITANMIIGKMKGNMTNEAKGKNVNQSNVQGSQGVNIQQHSR